MTTITETHYEEVARRSDFRPASGEHYCSACPLRWPERCAGECPYTAAYNATVATVRKTKAIQETPSGPHQKTQEIPETPEDCLLHCEHLFKGSYGELLYKMTITKIEALILVRSSAAAVAAIEETHKRAMTLLTRPRQETYDDTTKQ